MYIDTWNSEGYQLRFILFPLMSQQSTKIIILLKV